MSLEKLPVSVKVACALLHCTQETVYAWIKSGTVEGTRVDGERWEVWLPAELLPKSAKNEAKPY